MPSNIELAIDKRPLSCSAGRSGSLVIRDDVLARAETRKLRQDAGPLIVA